MGVIYWIAFSLSGLIIGMIMFRLIGWYIMIPLCYVCGILLGLGLVFHPNFRKKTGSHL